MIKLRLYSLAIIKTSTGYHSLQLFPINYSLKYTRKTVAMLLSKESQIITFNYFKVEIPSDSNLIKLCLNLNKQRQPIYQVTGDIIWRKKCVTINVMISAFVLKTFRTYVIS